MFKLGYILPTLITIAPIAIPIILIVFIEKIISLTAVTNL